LLGSSDKLTSGDKIDEMDRQAFEILEFPSLRALVQRRAQTESARSVIEQLEPVADLKRLQKDLERLGEMIELRRRGPALSFDGVANVTEAVSRLRIEGTALQSNAFLDVARLCARALEARAAILAEREAAPALFEIVASLPAELGKLAATITQKILPSGELDDRASPQLAKIRREQATARSRITRSLESLMRRSSEAIQEELVTLRNDRFVIPVRSDHQARIKGVAHGSSSSGATVFIEPLETIEANNELQNLREAEQREIAEILFALSERLRRELPAIEAAAAAIAQLDFINAKAAFGESFDCVVPEVMAQTHEVSTGSGSDRIITDTYTSRHRSDPVATAPGTDFAALEFINARHPLLEENLRAAASAVVPVSFRLDGDHPVMVISGANAGGKTVVLKTAGLLALMALSGLPVPAKSARVPFYRSILADIGDHQSLAANLSTFTSHVGNIATMIDTCVTPALVLLDEVGTGTDPEEGSALGVAVVDHFKRRGAQVMATTHYAGLKMYAANEGEVQNASVEFDEQTLQPTYRLLVGLAGSSSGLEIARRFGIPDQVIKSAANQVSQSSREATGYLRRIKHEAEEAEAQRQALEEERVATAEKFAALDKQFHTREAERRREFEAALKQTITDFEKLSRDLLTRIEDRSVRAKVEREAEARAVELRREAQRAAQAMSQAARSETAARRGKSESKEGRLPPQLQGIKVVRDGEIISDGRELKRKEEPVDTNADSLRAESDVRVTEPRDLRVGDRVRSRSLGSIGLIDRIKGDEAELRIGTLHMREKLANLELVSGPGVSSHAQDARTTNEVSTSRGSGRVKASLADLQKRRATTELHLHSRAADAKVKSPSELNLIGKTTDEAVDLVDKFLDEAFLNGQREVRIIHGHGTGALRKAIAELLADHPHVARFSTAPQDQGGSGATIVELRS
jgi:DNA mismatch repair protein MutS2